MDEEESKLAQRATAESAFHLAVASLALALLAAAAGAASTAAGIWWYYDLETLARFAPLLAIPGLISGHMALRALKRGGRARRIRGTAIAGLVTGYAALAWFLLFMYAASRPETHGSRGVACKNNLKQIGLAMHLYATDYDGWYPIGAPDTESSYALGTLGYSPDPYILDAGLFLCPGSEDSVGAWRRIDGGRSDENGGLRPSSTSYAYVPGLRADSQAELMVVFDKTAENHKDRRNVLFVDGHVQYLKEEEFQRRLAEQEELLQWLREVANRDELFRWGEGRPVRE